MHVRETETFLDNFFVLLKCIFTKLRREEKACVSRTLLHTRYPRLLFTTTRIVCLVGFPAWINIRKRQRSRSGLLHLLPLGTLIIQKLIKYRSRLLSIACLSSLPSAHRYDPNDYRFFPKSHWSHFIIAWSLERWGVKCHSNNKDQSIWQTDSCANIAYSAGVIFIHIAYRQAKSEIRGKVSFYEIYFSF